MEQGWDGGKGPVGLGGRWWRGRGGVVGRDLGMLTINPSSLITSRRNYVTTLFPSEKKNNTLCSSYRISLVTSIQPPAVPISLVTSSAVK